MTLPIEFPHTLSSIFQILSVARVAAPTIGVLQEEDMRLRFTDLLLIMEIHFPLGHLIVPSPNSPKLQPAPEDHHILYLPG